ncbi:hypothetical protein Bccel_1248 [Pseudobacteroides cellulosolvens ATCC 35603 = DSM 2933]|uniref:Uncharacterized protein n=1 Tax=Pseudobacteroides cellulosolvens ATCC 35603 = DSM 2933 TaxID=398512 RepID=A0A0L6JJV5_9FIRM|nr:hypothetical protein Bccel_1248 [Pseudobacteroides cellulosolvens ATCC 35603 = DSM 2933]
MGKSTNNFIQQSSSVNKSKNTPVVVEEGVNIHIKNSKGEIHIKDSKLAEELIQIVENSPKVIKTGTSCPFGNKVTIYKNQVIQKEFIIAEDGCNTIQRTDGTIIEIEKTLYKKIESALNNLNNSLNRINR